MNPRNINRALTLLLGATLCTSANAQTKLDKTQYGLRDSVKTIRVEVAEFTQKDGKRIEGKRVPLRAGTYDGRGNIVERVDFNHDGSMAQTLIYTFDAEGRGTGYEDYAGDMSIPRRHVYVLDQNGNRTEYGIIQPDGSPSEKYLYKYDTFGNKVAEALYHKGALISRNENVFDDQGRLVSQIIYHPDGSVSSRSRNSNDSEGRPIERIRHDEDLLTYRVRYTYDIKGRLVGLETVGSFVETDGSGWEAYPTGKVVYVYNGKEQPKETLFYNQNGSLRWRVVFVYDARGNWIKRTRMVQPAMNGKAVPLHSEYRTITYHQPLTR